VPVVISRPAGRRRRSPRVRIRVRAVAALLGALGLLVALPGSASASPATIQRAVSNLLLGPLDIVLSPVVALRTEVENLRNVDDTRGVRIAYAVPGYFWLTGVQLGAGGLRIGTGFIELVPGVALWFFPNTDMEPLFDPVDRGEAIVDFQNPLYESPAWVSYVPVTMPVTLNLKFGVNYTTPAF
jgi:hypothetical protein